MPVTSLNHKPRSGPPGKVSPQPYMSPRQFPLNSLPGGPVALPTGPSNPCRGTTRDRGGSSCTGRRGRRPSRRCTRPACRRSRNIPRRVARSDSPCAGRSRTAASASPSFCSPSHRGGSRSRARPRCRARRSRRTACPPSTAARTGSPDCPRGSTASSRSCGSSCGTWPASSSACTLPRSASATARTYRDTRCTRRRRQAPTGDTSNPARDRRSEFAQHFSQPTRHSAPLVP